ncbi:MAG: hypothetical protein ACK4UK_09790, partial [Flavobacterium sp.]
MKKTLYYWILLLIISGCNLFENKEKRAIEIVQQSKMQIETDNIFANLFLGYAGMGQNSTWLDFANMIAKKDPNLKYTWKAKPTDEIGIYMVSFIDEQSWGHRWEVAIEEQTVKHINQNEYLSRKYGFSRLDNDGKFNKKRSIATLLITISIIQLIFGYNNYKNFSEAYIELANNNASFASQIVQKDVQSVISKGVSYSQLHDLEVYLEDIVTSVNELAHIQISYGEGQN